jgi:hypothetical protein
LRVTRAQIELLSIVITVGSRLGEKSDKHGGMPEAATASTAANEREAALKVEPAWTVR